METENTLQQPNTVEEDFQDLDSSQDSTDVCAEDQQSTSTKATASTMTKKGKKEEKKPTKIIPKKQQRLVFNVYDTQYDVIKYVGKKLFGWKLSYDPEKEWDVCWTDNQVTPEFLSRMQPYMKVNHFPGMYSIARKNNLGRHLMRMKKAFPDTFKFFPPTWLLPFEMTDFKSNFSQKKRKTYIVKPEASSQGKGIFLTRSWEPVANGERYVVQRYLHKPYLIDDLKFDLRIYVLLAGCDPLRIYLFNDGLGRFATEKYQAPTAENINDMCMHLTNYAINKENPNYVFNEDANDTNTGHKKSIKAVFKILEAQGHNTKKIWDEIKKIIIKTLCSVQPILAHSYKSCHPDEIYNNMCFEVLGFDVMLDHKLKPWLIEVNHTPSFATDTPFDKDIKKNLIKDAMKIMHITNEQKVKYKNKKRIEMQKRVLTGKKVRITVEERKKMCDDAQRERDEYENKHLGGYEKIFPIENPAEDEEDYQAYLKESHRWFLEWTGTSVKKPKKPKEEKEDAPPPKAKSKPPAGPSTGDGGPTNAQKRARDIESIYSQKLLRQKPTSRNGDRKSNPGTPNNAAGDGAITIIENGHSNNRESVQGLSPERMEKQPGFDEDDKDFMEHVKAAQLNAIDDEQAMAEDGDRDISPKNYLREVSGNRPDNDKKDAVHNFIRGSYAPHNRSGTSTTNDSTNFRIRTHNNNPNNNSGFKDNSKAMYQKGSHEQLGLTTEDFLERNMPNTTNKFQDQHSHNQYNNTDYQKYLKHRDEEPSLRQQNSYRQLPQKGPKGKVALKLNSGIVGEFQNNNLLNQQIINHPSLNSEMDRSMDPLQQIRNPLSSNNQIIHARNPLEIPSYPGAKQRQQQQANRGNRNNGNPNKYNNGSFVAPKLVEFNFQATKPQEVAQRLGGFQLQGVSLNKTGGQAMRIGGANAIRDTYPLNLGINMQDPGNMLNTMGKYNLYNPFGKK